MAIIELRNITRRFASNVTDTLAVDDVSLSIDKGGIHGIIGFSGAGKSTLLRTINLLERPDKGCVFVDGEDLTALSKAQLRNRRRSIGMIFQHFNLIQNATVFQNVSFPLEIAGIARAERRQRVEETLRTVGLIEKAHVYPAKLSGGQKQRVGIARTLVAQPKILLCDEPTSALDPLTTESILEFLEKLNRELGLTIVVVTHEMDVVNAICDTVSVMEQGKLVDTIDLAGDAITPRAGIASYLFSRSEKKVRRYA